MMAGTNTSIRRGVTFDVASWEASRHGLGTAGFAANIVYYYLKH